MFDKAGYKTEISDAFMTDPSFLKVGDTIEVYTLWKNKGGNTGEKADIVSIASPLTCQAENAVRVGNMAKETDSSILTVVGGPYVAVMRVEFLKEAKNRYCSNWLKGIYNAP